MKEPVSREASSNAGASSMLDDQTKMKTMSRPENGLEASRETLIANGPQGSSIAAQVANAMAAEMHTNVSSSKVAEIRSKWNSWWEHDKIHALVMFKEMVDYGAPWDHKKFLVDNYGQWHHDPQNRCEWFFDIWSNIHYGYIGKACGFSEGLLLEGAGLAQLKSSSVPGGWAGWWDRVGTHGLFGALDDSSDQMACTLGCILHGQNFGGSTLLHLMKSNKGRLTHRATA
jgi:hypothetical protein